MLIGGWYFDYFGRVYYGLGIVEIKLEDYVKLELLKVVISIF
jgi:hypothetical protein